MNCVLAGQITTRSTCLGAQVHSKLLTALYRTLYRAPLARLDLLVILKPRDLAAVVRLAQGRTCLSLTTNLGQDSTAE